jgi:phospholipase D1/2
MGHGSHPAMDAPVRRKLWIAAAAIGSLLVALALAWKFTPLGEAVTPRNVVDTLESVSGRWWTQPLLVFLFTPAALVMFPRPLLTLAAVAVFGFAHGFALSMAGVLLSALVFYFAGSRIDERRLERMAGPRMGRIKKLLQKEGLKAVTVVGLLPVAPFTVEMLIFGALRVKVHHVLIGVFLAMLPGMLGTTVLGHQFMAAMREGGEANRWIVGLTLVALVALGWFTRRWWKRVEKEL